MFISVISLRIWRWLGCLTAWDRQDSRRNGIICLNFTIASYKPSDAKKPEERGTATKSEAKERLRHAIELDKEARKLALEDEDLKPPWDWIGGLK